MAAPLSLTVRRAQLADLPVIQELIRDSYNAMAEYYPWMAAGLAAAIATITTTGDLAAANFATEYSLTERADENAVYWVAEQPSAEGAGPQVVGCVAFKRLSVDDGELCRMAVSPNVRGGGIGRRLVAALEAYAGKLEDARLSVLSV